MGLCEGFKFYTPNTTFSLCSIRSVLWFKKISIQKHSHFEEKKTFSKDFFFFGNN